MVDDYDEPDKQFTLKQRYKREYNKMWTFCSTIDQQIKGNSYAHCSVRKCFISNDISFLDKTLSITLSELKLRLF